ncbi:MAG: metallophosphoesterase family protein [Myxococcales bacterium]|nr:metallophosphoesterase family protein [Myxococcales bacterium]
MRALTLVPLVSLTAATACVAGNPLPDRPYVDRLGGSIVPPGCPHTMVTRFGVEAPGLPGTVVGADPTIGQVHLGLVGDPRTSMVVDWRTADDATTTGTVRFGVGTALDLAAPGLTFTYAADFGNGAIVRMHEAHLCGLTADTVYSYQIEAAPGVTSPTYQFRTAPDPALTPDAEVTIGAVGDSRDGYDVWAQVVDQLIARAPDVIVFSGDAVTLGQQQREWDEFFIAAEPLFTRVPVVSVHGNHDINAPNYYAQLAMPGDEENYSFDYGHAHLVVVNDTPEQLADLTGKIPAFLTADLAAHASAPWLIVNHHRPVYSASTRHGSDTTLRDTWAPIFDQAQVDLVLNGHDHDYERTKPMRGNQVAASAADGTIYVVSGGAGAELYENGSDFWTQTSASLHSATVARVRAAQLAFEAFDQSGAAVDAFTIVRP